MKLSDFEITGIVTAPTGSELVGEITITTTTGHLWWKRTHRVVHQIARHEASRIWYVSATGQRLPWRYMLQAELEWVRKTYRPKQPGHTTII